MSGQVGGPRSSDGGPGGHVTRIEIYRAFARRAHGEFPCSWNRHDFPQEFDEIQWELTSMDSEGLLGCLLEDANDVVTAQLSREGIGKMHDVVMIPRPSEDSV